MNRNNVDSLSLRKARDYAFLLLKFRLRSEKELYQRFKKKKFNEETMNKVLLFLKEKGFINDDYFARAWIESRIKKPLGLQRLRQELKLKGIDKEIIDKQIGEIKRNYCEPDIVLRIAQERFNRLKGIEPQKAKRRLYAWFLRRGFSPHTVIDVLSQL